MISASEAKNAGLVAEVVSDADALSRAVDLAELIAGKSPIAARLAKQAVLASRDVSLESGLALERKLWSALFGTLDAREGMAAFLEKRKPRFEGR